MKRKNVLRITLALLLTVTTAMSGCSAMNSLSQMLNSGEIEASTEEAGTGSISIVEEPTAEWVAAPLTLASRRVFISEESMANLPEYTPSVEPYQAEANLSNVENVDRFYLQDQILDKLAANNFVVVNGGGSEFFDVYEMNRYNQTPNFVTVDSMMHTYHLYFAMLQKNTEKMYLYDDVKKISVNMLNASLAQYQILKGTEWEDAVNKNIIFFSVGSTLMGEQAAIPTELCSIVEEELSMVNEAAGISISPLTDDYEDYTQYKPRGYYEGNEMLERYFRTMMWYGHRNFAQKDETMDRCALLMSLALNNSAAEEWEEVYSITSFFAGASDDSGAYEYLPLIFQAYGENLNLEDLIGNTSAFDTYHGLTAQLDPPKINSTVLMDDGGATDNEEVSKGFRFMGQRFTLDGEIFTRLCYDNVGANSEGSYRMIPDSLDIPAAMGSDVALDVLQENGDFAYQGYETEMISMRADIANAPDSMWNASLYGSWLNTIKPLLSHKGEGYPSFMQSSEWDKKCLETYMGSFTELKHDTVLYSKQFVAEMGGGDEEILDDRGYVEPEPEVYARLSNLATCTSNGLQEFGIISANDQENLLRLAELADQLKEISIKELTGGEITEEEYELIRSYGGNLEHFWREAVRDDEGNEYYDSSAYPAALVVDVATDPYGTILEQAIGPVSYIYVIVPVDGKLRIASGSVFSYYQFEQPISNRLTDSEWRRMMGLELNDDMEYETEEDVQQPEWTQSYRSEWIWN